MTAKKSLVNQTVADLPPSGIRRFFDLVSEMKGVISLGVGEPDFVTPWHIREACIYSLEKGYTMYTSNQGLLELREEICNYLKRSYGVTYEPCKEVLVTVGVSEALDLALRAIVSPGDEVIVPEPCYVSYKPCTIMAGGIPVTVQTSHKDNFKLTAQALRDAITPKTKVLLLCYPNNPTGAILTKSEQEAIAEVVREHDLLVISDEIYGELTYEGKHTCFASLPGMQERTILLNGFSKAYAMTGWRIAYAAAVPEIIAAMNKIHQYTMLCAPIMGQKAALEALRSGEEEMHKMVKQYDRRRKLITKGFTELGMTCFEPKGAFYVFPSIQITGMTSDQFAEALLHEEKVALVPGSAFGASGEGFVRCSYAASVENITEAINRIERFLRNHNFI